MGETYSDCTDLYHCREERADRAGRSGNADLTDANGRSPAALKEKAHPGSLGASVRSVSAAIEVVNGLAEKETGRESRGGPKHLCSRTSSPARLLDRSCLSFRSHGALPRGAFPFHPDMNALVKRSERASD